MKDKILMIVFVLVLGSILTTALVAINGYTTPIIEKNEEITLKTSVLTALDISYEEENIEDIERTFVQKVERREKQGVTYYVSAEGDYAFPFEGSGLWGPIRGILALGPDLETITSITIIHQEETPGLGSRIADAEYLEKLEGKEFTPRLELTGEGKAEGVNEVDGITGATLSCEAFIKILNNEYESYSSLVAGE
jgi:Na+-transporting NADH:ubiquinone oxidoreductase subunit C